MIERMFDTMTRDAPFEPDLTGDPNVGRLDALVVAEQAFRLEVLARVVELDTDRVWVMDGATSMADWLAGRYALSIGTAREWVRVARAL